MAKFLKETPVYIACPACRKTQRAKLRWAKGHKALKCKDCKESIDLRAKPAKHMIAATLKAVTSFEKSLKALRRQAASSVKPKKKKSRPAAKKAPRARPKPAPAFLVPPQEG